VSAILVSPTVLISFLLLRNATQQILNQLDYLKFKKVLNKMFDRDELKKTIRASFMEVENAILSSGTRKMKLLDFDKKPALKHNFNLKLDENFEEFIKAKMEEQVGLIENPTEEQLQEIIQKKVKRKPKGEIVFFRNFIDKNTYESANFSNS
jgi:hypothetical protein